MSRKMIVTMLTACAVLAALCATGAAGASPSGQGAVLPGLASAVGSKISYQGRLSDPAGNPLTGSYDIKFELYTAPSGGTKLWEQTRAGVSVQNGLFNVQLDITPANFNGQALWLAITVNGQLLSPRQEILPAPYALSLRPGAVITDSIYSGAVVNIENTDASVNGGYGLWVMNASTNTWRPAIYGENTGASAGVYGRSDGWHAVVGWQQGANPDNAGVYGYNGGAGPGVKGFGGTGVYGESDAASGQGIYGHGSGELTEGVLGTSDLSAGVGGYSSGTGGVSIGVYGQTSGTYGLYTPQMIFSGGGCVGCTAAFIGQNNSDATFEIGDVVALTGVGAALNGQSTPVLLVAPYIPGGSHALGVVQTRMVVETTQMKLASGEVAQDNPMEVSSAVAGSVAPGDYLLIVVQGLAQVRVDAAPSAVQPGDTLYAGAATRAATLEAAETGIPVIGRALEPLAEGSGLIWVLVLGE
jgi:hypothetical protein